MNDNWPKHPDGRNKKLGEMSHAEQIEAIKPAVAKLKDEFESPEGRARLAAALSYGGGNA